MNNTCKLYDLYYKIGKTEISGKNIIEIHAKNGEVEIIARNAEPGCTYSTTTYILPTDKLIIEVP